MANVRGAVTVDPSAGPSVRLNVWVEDVDGQVTANIANCVVNLYTQAGVLLSGPHTDAAADAQGVFAVTFVDPGFAVGQTATYFVVTVDVGLVPVTTRGVIGVTFARSS